jgi:hypothetical protein
VTFGNSTMKNTLAFWQALENKNTVLQTHVKPNTSQTERSLKPALALESIKTKKANIIKPTHTRVHRHAKKQDGYIIIGIYPPKEHKKQSCKRKTSIILRLQESDKRLLINQTFEDQKRNEKQNIAPLPVRSLIARFESFTNSSSPRSTVYGSEFDQDIFDQDIYSDEDSEVQEMFPTRPIISKLTSPDIKITSTNIATEIGKNIAASRCKGDHGFLYRILSSSAHLKLKFKFVERMQFFARSNNQPNNVLTPEMDTEAEIVSMLNDSNGLELFLRYCERELSEENVYLWNDLSELIIDFEKLTSPEIIDRMHTLYVKFLKEGSELEVNVPAYIRQGYENSLKLNQSDQTRHDALEQLRMILLENLADSFSRYCMTQSYQTFRKYHRIKETIPL